MGKFAFIDVDGTLTTSESSWEKVHRHFDVIDKMEEHSQRFYSGQISYEEWALLDVKLWKGNPIEELQKALLPPDLIQGAKKGIRMLKNDGFTVILVSGGIDILVNEVANIVEADKSYANSIGHTDGIIDGTIDVTVGLKALVIEKINETNLIDYNESIAIGDNFNDVDMFEKMGNSIAFNPKSDDVAKTANVSIISDNFIDVANHVLEMNEQ